MARCCKHNVFNVISTHKKSIIIYRGNIEYVALRTPTAWPTLPPSTNVGSTINLKVFPFGYTYNGWPNVDKPTEFKPCHEANFDGDPMLARCCSTNGKIEKKVLLSHF